MKPIAFVTTLVGIGLVACAALLVNWHDSLTLADWSAQVSDGSSGADLPAIPRFFAESGWIVFGGLPAAGGLFAMFNGPKDRWIAFAGNFLVGGFVGYGSYNTWGTSSSRTSGETFSLIFGIVIAVVMLGLAVMGIRRKAWFGALLASLVSLIGVALSIWLIVSDGSGLLAWVMPVGFFVLLVGALMSIAAAGKDRSENPQPTKTSTPGVADDPSSLNTPAA